MAEQEQFQSKQIMLDFSECTYVGELHQEIQKKLELPDWYGKNLDALWDSITGIMYTPAKIKINPTARQKELQSTIDDIISLFQEAEQLYHEIAVCPVAWPNTDPDAHLGIWRTAFP